MMSDSQLLADAPVSLQQVYPCISIVTPVYNEQDTIVPLFLQIQAAIQALPVLDYEVIFVDDGSQDASGHWIQYLARQYPEQVREIRLYPHGGKTAALLAGIRQAKADVVFTLDSDLQDDPTEFAAFLQQLEAGYDLVCGWKQQRQDSRVRIAASRIFNGVLRTVFGLPLHDMNCGFKVFHKKVFDVIPMRGPMWGEMHRYIPLLAASHGFRVAEIPVSHRPRPYGQSKYGMGRYCRSLLDFFVVLLMTRNLFWKRPRYSRAG